MNAPAQRRGNRRRTAVSESWRRGCGNGRPSLALARHAPLAFALLIPLVLFGCEKRDGGAGDTSFRFRVQPDPPAVGPVTVEVILTDRSGAPRTGASLHLEGNMSHPGMKPVMGAAAEVRPGVYRAELELTMRGDWILTATATFPDGAGAEGTHELPGVTGS